MFFDVAKINAKGGEGGDGCMAMRRLPSLFMAIVVYNIEWNSGSTVLSTEALVAEMEAVEALCI